MSLGLEYAHYIATNGFIASQWTWPSACQMAIPGDRPFELCAWARIQSPRKIYLRGRSQHTNVSLNIVALISVLI